MRPFSNKLTRFKKKSLRISSLNKFKKSLACLHSPTINNSTIISSSTNLEIRATSSNRMVVAILTLASFRPSTSTKRFTICMRLMVWSPVTICTDVRKLWVAGQCKTVSSFFLVDNWFLVEGLMHELDPNH